MNRSIAARVFRASVAIACLVAVQQPVAQAEDADVTKGRKLAAAYCAKCHNIHKIGKSPLAIAPPFRTLHERYPVETLAEALAEGIMTGHPTMPQFTFEPDQIGALIAFLQSLEDEP